MSFYWIANCNCQIYNTSIYSMKSGFKYVEVIIIILHIIHALTRWAYGQESVFTTLACH